MPSTSFNPPLIGDVFNYVCTGFLVLVGNAENRCSLTGNEGLWSLSILSGNLPMCGKLLRI